MEKVIIDIGIGKTKSVIINGKNQIIPLYEKAIQFKEGYTPTLGLDVNHKQCLFETINKIKDMAEGRPIYIYATSIFRTMNDNLLKIFIREFEEITKLKFNVVTAEHESELMTKAVGELDLDEPYLIASVGNGSTEMNVMRKGKVIESVNTEFARADIVNVFPTLKEEICNIGMSEMEEFVRKNLKFPKLKSKYVIVLGFKNLSKLKDFKFKLSSNHFFNHFSVPNYIEYEQFVKETRKVLNTPFFSEHINLFRAHCIISKCILQEMEAKYCFPTDINMIDGIVEEFKQNIKKEELS